MRIGRRFMNSITFAPIIPTRQQRRDGTYNVKIRITFKRKSRFFSTNLFASPADLTTRSLKLKQGPLLARSNALIGEFQQALSGLSPLEMADMEVDDLVNLIRSTSRKERFVLDFFQWCDKRIPEKSAGARHNYLLATKAFERFLGKREMDINRITTKLLHDFSVFLDSEIRPNGKTVKKRGGASIRYVKSLGALFRDAQLYYNDEDEGRILIPRNPFEKVVYASKPSPSEGQNSLPFELMQRILLDRTTEPGPRLALDVFIVSFGLMGANLADLYAAGPFEGKTWRYYRQKTASRRSDKAEMRVLVPDCLAPYIGRLTDPQKKKWLRLYLINNDKDRVNSKLNRWLRIWQKKNGVQDFTLYAARHSWATLARSRAHVDKATIDECLAHSGTLNMADIYVEKDWDVINAANRALLSLFVWP